MQIYQNLLTDVVAPHSLRTTLLQMQRLCVHCTKQAKLAFKYKFANAHSLPSNDQFTTVSRKMTYNLPLAIFWAASSTVMAAG